jgi:hypothetical protein
MWTAVCAAGVAGACVNGCRCREEQRSGTCGEGFEKGRVLVQRTFLARPLTTTTEASCVSRGLCTCIACILHTLAARRAMRVPTTTTRGRRGARDVLQTHFRPSPARASASRVHLEVLPRLGALRAPAPTRTPSASPWRSGSAHSLAPLCLALPACSSSSLVSATPPTGCCTTRSCLPSQARTPPLLPCPPGPRALPTGRRTCDRQGGASGQRVRATARVQCRVPRTIALAEL